MQQTPAKGTHTGNQSRTTASSQPSPRSKGNGYDSNQGDAVQGRPGQVGDVSKIESSGYAKSNIEYQSSGGGIYPNISSLKQGNIIRELPENDGTPGTPPPAYSEITESNSASVANVQATHFPGGTPVPINSEHSSDPVNQFDSSTFNYSNAPLPHNQAYAPSPFNTAYVQARGQQVYVAAPGQKVYVPAPFNPAYVQARGQQVYVSVPANQTQLHSIAQGGGPAAIARVDPTSVARPDTARAQADSKPAIPAHVTQGEPAPSRPQVSSKQINAARVTQSDSPRPQVSPKPVNAARFIQGDPARPQVSPKAVDAARVSQGDPDDRVNPARISQGDSSSRAASVNQEKASRIKQVHVHTPVAQVDTVSPHEEIQAQSGLNPNDSLPSNSKSKQAIDPQTNLKLLVELCNQIEASEQNAEAAAGKDIVFIIGKTGAGKTTLIHHLCGKRIIAVDPNENSQPGTPDTSTGFPKKANGKFAVKKKIKFDVRLEDRIPGLTVGHEAKSETSSVIVVNPNDYFSCADSDFLLLGDTPGFIDTVGALKDVANNTAIYNAARKARSVRFCLVLGRDTVTEGKSDNLREIFSCVGKLVKNISDRIDSMIFIITRISMDEADFQNKGDFYSILHDYLEGVTSTFAQNNLSLKNPEIAKIVTKLHDHVVKIVDSDEIPLVENQIIRPYHPEVQTDSKDLWTALNNRTPITDTSSAFDLPLAGKSMNEIALEMNRYREHFKTCLQVAILNEDNLEYILCMFRLCAPFMRMSAQIPPITQHFRLCKEEVRASYMQRWNDINGETTNLILNAPQIHSAQMESLSPLLNYLNGFFTKIIAPAENGFQDAQLPPPEALVTSCVNAMRKCLKDNHHKRLAEFIKNPESFRTNWPLELHQTMDKLVVVGNFFKSILGDKQVIPLGTVYEEAAGVALELLDRFVTNFRSCAMTAGNDVMLRLNEERDSFKVFESHHVLLPELQKAMEATSWQVNESCAAAIKFIDSLVNAASLQNLAENIAELPQHWQVLIENARPYMQSGPKQLPKNHPVALLNGSFEKLIQVTQRLFMNDFASGLPLFAKIAPGQSDAPERKPSSLPSESLKRLILEFYCIDIFMMADARFQLELTKATNLRIDALNAAVARELGSTHKATSAAEIEVFTSHRAALRDLVFGVRLIDCVGPGELVMPTLHARLYQSIFQEIFQWPAELSIKQVENLNKRGERPSKWSPEVLQQVSTLGALLKKSFFSTQDLNDWWTESVTWISSTSGEAISTFEPNTVKAKSATCDISPRLAQIILGSEKSTHRQMVMSQRLVELQHKFEVDVRSIEGKIGDVFFPIISKNIEDLQKYASKQKSDSVAKVISDLELLRQVNLFTTEIDESLSSHRDRTFSIATNAAESIKALLQTSAHWHLPGTWKAVAIHVDTFVSVPSGLYSNYSNGVANHIQNHNDLHEELKEMVLKALEKFIRDQQNHLETSEVKSKAGSFGLFGRLGMQYSSFYHDSSLDETSTELDDDDRISSAKTATCNRVDPFQIQELKKYSFDTLLKLDPSSSDRRVTSIKDKLKDLIARIHSYFSNLANEFDSALQNLNAKQLLRLLDESKTGSEAPIASQSDKKGPKNLKDSSVEQPVPQSKASGTYLVMLEAVFNALKKESEDLQQWLQKCLEDVEYSFSCNLANGGNLGAGRRVAAMLANSTDRKHHQVDGKYIRRNLSGNELPNVGSPQLVGVQTMIPGDLLESLAKFSVTTNTLQDHLKFLPIQRRDKIASNASDAQSSMLHEDSKSQRGKANSSPTAESDPLDFMHPIVRVFQMFISRVETEYLSNPKFPRRLQASACLSECLDEMRSSIGNKLESDYIEKKLQASQSILEGALRCVINSNDPDAPAHFEDRLINIENDIKGLPEPQRTQVIDDFRRNGVDSISTWFDTWLAYFKASIEGFESFSQHFPVILSHSQSMMKQQNRSGSNMTGSQSQHMARDMHPLSSNVQASQQRDRVSSQASDLSRYQNDSDHQGNRDLPSAKAQPKSDVPQSQRSNQRVRNSTPPPPPMNAFPTPSTPLADFPIPPPPVKSHDQRHAPAKLAPTAIILAQNSSAPKNQRQIDDPISRPLSSAQIQMRMEDAHGLRDEASVQNLSSLNESNRPGKSPSKRGGTNATGAGDDFPSCHGDINSEDEFNELAKSRTLTAAPATDGTSRKPPSLALFKVSYVRLVLKDSVDRMSEDIKRSIFSDAKREKKYLILSERYKRAVANFGQPVKDSLQRHESDNVGKILLLHIDPTTLFNLLHDEFGHRNISKRTSSKPKSEPVQRKQKGERDYKFFDEEEDDANHPSDRSIRKRCERVLKSKAVESLRALLSQQREKKEKMILDVLTRFNYRRTESNVSFSWRDIELAMKALCKEIRMKSEAPRRQPTRAVQNAKNSRMDADPRKFIAGLDPNGPSEKLFRNTCDHLAARIISSEKQLLGNNARLIFPSPGSTSEANLLLKSIQESLAYFNIFSIFSNAAEEEKFLGISIIDNPQTRSVMQRLGIADLKKIDRPITDRLLAYSNSIRKFMELWDDKNLNDSSEDFKETLNRLQWIVRFLQHQQKQDQGRGSQGVQVPNANNWVNVYLEKRKNLSLANESEEDAQTITDLADVDKTIDRIKEDIDAKLNVTTSPFEIQNCDLKLSNVLLLNCLVDFKDPSGNSLTFLDHLSEEKDDRNSRCKHWLNQLFSKAERIWDPPPQSDSQWTVIKATIEDLEKVDRAASPSLRKYLGLNPLEKISRLVLDRGVEILREYKKESMEKIKYLQDHHSDKLLEIAVNSFLLCKSWSKTLPQLAKDVNAIINDQLQEIKKEKSNKEVQAIGRFLEKSEEPLLREILDEHPSIFKALNNIRFLGNVRLKPLDTIKSIEGDDICVSSLRTAFQLFDEEYMRLIKVHISQSVPTDELVLNIKQSSASSFQADRLPILMAEIFALWSAIDESSSFDNDKNEQSIRRPQPAQVLSIMRLFGIGFIGSSISNQIYNYASYAVDQGREMFGIGEKKAGKAKARQRTSAVASANQLAEIKTGEGKSVTLGVLCILFALMGRYPCCVCYSDLLSARDYHAFEDMFELLGVSNRIAYSTITNLCEVILNRGADIREETKRAVGFKTLGTSSRDFGIHGSMDGLKTGDTSKCVLLIDEVDVLFSESFYGRCYNPSVLCQSNATKNFVLDMWDRVNQIRNINDITGSSQYQAVLKEFDSSMKDIIEDVAFAMLFDLKRMDQHNYEVTPDGQIGYKRNGKISHHHEGFKTMFAYIKEFRKGNIPESSMENQIGISLVCGKYAFASMLREFGLILGVTGTLRQLSEFECKAMSENYGISKRTYLPSIYGENQLEFFEDDDVKVIFKHADWHRYIQQQAQAILNKQRCVLIFFDTKEQLIKFQNSSYCEFQDCTNLQRIVEGETEYIEEIVKKATHSGAVTLLTRAFGRGIDFVSRDQRVIDNGGVHVIQTFFCDTITEEVQIKGRTARQGDKGSYEQVLFADDITQGYSLGLEELKNATKQRGIYGYLCNERLRSMESHFADRQKKVEESEESHLESMDFFHCHLSQVSADTFQCLRKIQNIKRVSGGGLNGNASPLHTLVCIDISGSMSAGDAKPSGNAPAHQQNRLGCVIEATKKYIAYRRSKCSTDKISIITFDDKAYIIVQEADVNKDFDEYLDKIDTIGGTSFDAPIKTARGIIENSSSNGCDPYIFFLSDGDGACTSAPNDAAHLRNHNPKFRIDTIIFGPSLGGKETLINLATSGGGKFLESVSSTEELEEVMIDACERYF